MTGRPTYHRLHPGTAHLLRGAEMFDHAVDPAQLAAFLADPAQELIFAVAEGVPVGFASGTVLLHPDKRPAFLVNEVGVEPPWRRRGVATALCGALMARARARGCVGIWLATEAENAAARALYRKLGARETRGVVVCDWDGAMGA